MSVVVEGTVTVVEADNEITSLRWAINPWPACGSAPTEVSYLRKAHGDKSPQALVMTAGDEELIAFWHANDVLSDRVYRFLKATGEITIMAIDEQTTQDNESEPTCRTWTVDIAVFLDYIDTLTAT